MRILITAGGTREYIDPVRFISNASSGRMGYALARAALKSGHKVVIITTIENSKLETQNSKLKIIKVVTAAEMFKAVKKHFRQCDCLIMSAAVADYTPVRRVKTKIRKQDKTLSIKLKPTADILKWAGKHKKKDQIVVGFALEDKAIRNRAAKKLKEKNLDMIVANTPAAIGADKSTVQIKTPCSGWMKIKNVAKAAIAERIIAVIEKAIYGNHQRNVRCI